VLDITRRRGNRPGARYDAAGRFTGVKIGCNRTGEQVQMDRRTASDARLVPVGDMLIFVEAASRHPGGAQPTTARGPGGR